MKPVPRTPRSVGVAPAFFSFARNRETWVSMTLDSRSKLMSYTLSSSSDRVGESSIAAFSAPVAHGEPVLTHTVMLVTGAESSASGCWQTVQTYA